MKTSLAEFNGSQCSYFESRVPPTMVPRPAPYIERHIDAVVSALRLTGGEKIIEAGAGMGRYSIPLHNRGIQVLAQDLSEVLLKRLQQYAQPHFTIPVRAFDLHQPPGDLTGQFDVVLGFFMLHHLADLEMAIAGMRSLLKPGGRMVFVEPNPYNPLYYFQILLSPGMSWQGDKGILNMRRSLLFPAAKKAGLKNMFLKRFGCFPPFITNLPGGAKLEALCGCPLALTPFPPFQLFYADLRD